MSDDVRRYLDGEASVSDLEGDALREAEAWNRMLETFRVGSRSGGAPPWLEDRVMAEIEALPRPNRVRRLWAWLVDPQPVRITPLWAAVGVAAVAALLLLPPGLRSPGTPGPATPSTTGPGTPVSGASASGEGSVIYVQFVLEAPGANSVVVAGDFDGWEGSHTLSDPDGDGTWSGRVPVRPGVHTYMFLIDGSEWVTDPEAERYTDDGFGNRNAVLAVAAPLT